MSNQNLNQNDIFPEPKSSVVTNKGKITLAALIAGGVAFIGVAAGSNILNSKSIEEAEQNKKDSTSDPTNIPAAKPAQWDNVTNIAQNEKNPAQEISQLNQNNEFVTQKRTSFGDQDVNSIQKAENQNQLQIEKKANESDIEIDKVTRQLEAEKAIKNAEDSEIYLGSRKKAAKSPYEVMAGSVIPATLQIGLNSDLPGHATAIVRQNVYDSVSGNFLLIPKGTKLFGKYESKVAYGQKRLLMEWNRLIFSDGASISLKDMGGTDKEGYSGFADQVDNHFANLLSGAILMSIIGAGAQLSQPNTPSNGTYPSTQQQFGQVIAGQMGNQISTITGQVVQKSMNVQPTIVIRPGYEFNVLVNKDIILEPIVSN